MTDSVVKQLGQGFYWEDLTAGERFRTPARTVRESDLTAFISTTGMLEAIFIEDNFDGSRISGKPVPAVLTHSLIEGFILQTMIQRTGLAMLELALKVHDPVRVGDTIYGEITVKSVKPTSKTKDAVVVSDIEVFVKRRDGSGEPDALVMTYTATRLLAGRPTDPTGTAK
ncbi:MaoC family dehydratase [Cupriavidus malaysiensis]|uniref:Acyl dehydratase n=1 Tax=Cupriavidus malaysiensis TaxID=367825 RepID=A0A1D9IGD8_9BURK|nr:acyl dehydratase [Cupriavidus malaysiensis]AOZ11172.1 acyl dehydratase [Cupriavidus malaysiensis]